MAISSFRRDWLSKPIFGWAQRVLPSLSDTEREAIEAGDVWWDADLFTGNPEWSKLLTFPPAKLNPEEQAFLDGPVEELCRMTNEWQISWELGDLPPEVWDFLKAHKFFAMIIPKKYGGLEFSAYAHSEVIRKLSTHSITTSSSHWVQDSDSRFRNVDSAPNRTPLVMSSCKTMLRLRNWRGASITSGPAIDARPSAI